MIYSNISKPCGAADLSTKNDASECKTVPFLESDLAIEVIFCNSAVVPLNVGTNVSSW